MIVLWVIEGLAAMIAAVITVNTIGNLRAFRRLADFAADAVAQPFVSVLIPARDEAANIAACLQSLRGQEYSAYEIIVLDDQSSDATAAIVAEIGRGDPRLSLIAGGAVPPGWIGKAYACHQLSEAARGDVLLFTDADTRHAPSMIRSVVGAMAAGADVVTAFPRQEVRGWSEALAVPFMLFTVWAFLPVGRVWTDPSPRFVAANGQLLAFTRDAYTSIGGHAAVRSSALEDMDLARRAKRHGLRLRLADGTGTVCTRMYASGGDLLRGFSKNAYLLLGASPVGAIAFAALMLALYVMPVALLIAGVIAHRGGWAWRGLPVILVLLMLVQRALVAVRTRQPLWLAPTQPASVLFFLVILANAMRWHRRGHGEWKGRTYATTYQQAGEAPE